MIFISPKQMNGMYQRCNVGCVLPLVIWSELRIEQYWDHGYQEDAPLCIITPNKNNATIEKVGVLYFPN